MRWGSMGLRGRRSRLASLSTSSMAIPGLIMPNIWLDVFSAHSYKSLCLLKDVEEIGTYMWHGGSHHVGYDVHDVVERPEGNAGP